ncbi:MAG: hydrogenase formation protein HypD [Deltaproteobacteria bacterium]|jgi:hydrogenase expression/formation protein HypD|nr:hydrogenase formation protein HypD [Deltaproteobacteria bacterium]
MKYITEYRDREKANAIANRIVAVAKDQSMTIMEVCGTHTMALARFGIRQILPQNINLISGPGCPVCVTPNRYLDHAIALARQDNTIICTFGDMIKVPGSTSSLESERARGQDIRIVYSTLDALELARNNIDKEIIFLGVGFETTAPTIAASIDIASRQSISNYSVLCANKVVPPALLALLSGRTEIDGFILPGHVSTIIGSESYTPIFEKHPVACSIAGFEPSDMLEAIYELAVQISSGDPKLHNSYRRVVTANGNIKAKALLNRIFEASDAEWRGIGNIPESGLSIRDEFSSYDAAKKFNVTIEETVEPAGCRCGEILTGNIKPADCPLFGNNCTPSHPIGACMVSSEGTCAAHFKYGS